jgi:hypothetical protein
MAPIMEASFSFFLVFSLPDGAMSLDWLFDIAFFVDVADIFFTVGEFLTFSSLLAYCSEVIYEQVTQIHPKMHHRRLRSVHKDSL